MLKDPIFVMLTAVVDKKSRLRLWTKEKIVVVEEERRL
jgi:hypothetical protein